MSAWISERIWGVLHQLQGEEHDQWTNVCGCVLKKAWAWRDSVSWHSWAQDQPAMCLGEGENELWPLVFWLSGVCSSATDLNTLFSLAGDRLLDRNFLTWGSRLQTSLARARKTGKMSPVDSLYSVKIAADNSILFHRNTWRKTNPFAKTTRSGWANCQISPMC